MSIELLQKLSLISYIGAAALFILAVLLFFALKIPKLISDVSGRSAKKAIEQLRQQNENSGDKKYQPSAVNAARGKVTDKISPSGRLSSASNDSGAPRTEKFATESLIPQASETTVLPDSNGIANNATVILEQPCYPTQSSMSETTVLTGSGYGNLDSVTPVQTEKFHVDFEMKYTGSTEVIE